MFVFNYSIKVTPKNKKVDRLNMIVKSLGDKVPIEHLIMTINMYERWENSKSGKDFLVTEYSKVLNFKQHVNAYTRCLGDYTLVPTCVLKTDAAELINAINSVRELLLALKEF